MVKSYQQKGRSVKSATTKRMPQPSSRSEAKQKHSRAREEDLRVSSGSSRKRHSKAMGVPRQHVRREVRIGVRLPADQGEVAKQNVVLEILVL